MVTSSILTLYNEIINIRKIIQMPWSLHFSCPPLPCPFQTGRVFPRHADCLRGDQRVGRKEKLDPDTQ